MPETLDAAFPRPDHDHEQCLETAIARARSVCENRGVKFTNLRERVFRTIAGSHTAIGAYEIIDMLAKTGKKIAPISMYRILDTLSEIGLIHRLESRNSYFACHSAHGNGEERRLIFLICNSCDTVVETEAPEIEEAIEKVSESADFQLSEALLEIVGLCRHCDELKRQEKQAE